MIYYMINPLIIVNWNRHLIASEKKRPHGAQSKHSKAFSHRILIFRGSFQWSYEMKVVGLQWKWFHCKTQNHLKTILLAIFLQSQAVTRLTRIASYLLFTGSSISVCSHVFFLNPLIFNWSHHIHRETVETNKVMNYPLCIPFSGLLHLNWPEHAMGWIMSFFHELCTYFFKNNGTFFFKNTWMFINYL